MKEKDSRTEAKLHGTPIMCLFCKESVLDNYLELHIKYDHKIGHEVAVAQLLAMHFPGKSNESKSSTETNKHTEFCQEKDNQEEILRPPDPESNNCQNVVPEKDINNDSKKEQNNALGDNILGQGDKSLKSDKSINSNTIPTETEIVGEMVDEITYSPNHVTKPLPIGLSESSSSYVSSPNTSDKKVDEFSEALETNLEREEIFLSAFGVRFKCPFCEYVDEKVGVVRDHMATKHGKKSNINKSPKRQDMRVNIKPPRIHKETFEKALAYYKSFGGLFLKSGICANFKFVRDPEHRIKDLAKVSELSQNKSPPKSQAQEDEKNLIRKPGPKRRMEMQSESDIESNRKGKYSSKRHQKPLHTKVDLSVTDKKINLDFENQKESDIEWNVDLFDEIDLDVQNQLLAEADYTGLFDEHASLIFGDSNKGETTDSEVYMMSKKRKTKKSKIILDENMSLSKLIFPRIKRTAAKTKITIQDSTSRQRKRSPSSTRLQGRSKSIAATNRHQNQDISIVKKDMIKHPSIDETRDTLSHSSKKLPKPMKCPSKERRKSVVSTSLNQEKLDINLLNNLPVNNTDLADDDDSEIENKLPFRSRGRRKSGKRESRMIMPRIKKLDVPKINSHRRGRSRSRAASTNRRSSSTSWKRNRSSSREKSESEMSVSNLQLRLSDGTDSEYSDGNEDLELSKKIAPIKLIRTSTEYIHEEKDKSDDQILSDSNESIKEPEITLIYKRCDNTSESEKETQPREDMEEYPAKDKEHVEEHFEKETEVTKYFPKEKENIVPEKLMEELTEEPIIALTKGKEDNAFSLEKPVQIQRKYGDLDYTNLFEKSIPSQRENQNEQLGKVKEIEEEEKRNKEPENPKDLEEPEKAEELEDIENAVSTIVSERKQSIYPEMEDLQLSLHQKHPDVSQEYIIPDKIIDQPLEETCSTLKMGTIQEKVKDTQEISKVASEILPAQSCEYIQTNLFNVTSAKAKEISPIVKPRIDPKSLYHCDLCDFEGCDRYKYEKHLDSQEHRAQLRLRSNSEGEHLVNNDDASETEQDLVIDFGEETNNEIIRDICNIESNDEHSASEQVDDQASQETINDLSFQDLDLEAKESAPIFKEDASAVINNPVQDLEGIIKDANRENECHSLKENYELNDKKKESDFDETNENNSSNSTNETLTKEITGSDAYTENSIAEINDKNFDSSEYVSYVTNINMKFSSLEFNQREYSINLPNVLKTQKNYKCLLKNVTLSSEDDSKKKKEQKKRHYSSPMKRGNIVSVTEDGYHIGWRVEDPKNDSDEDDEDNNENGRRRRRGMVIPAEMQLPEGSTKYTRRGRGMKKQGEALQQLLTYLMNFLVKKDTNKWFSVPMNDRIAPGYSDKVSEPMDFTTMENKLDTQEYSTVDQLRYDFKLICKNCMAFNKPETCYYKAAKRLENFGLQILSKRNLREIVIDRPLYSGLTPFELGFDVFDPTDTDEEDIGLFFDDDSLSRSDSAMETIQSIEEVEHESKEEIKATESKPENKEIAKKKRGRKRKESPFITKLDEKTKAVLESKFNSNHGNEKMPEIKFNVMKEVPATLLSEEEKTKLVKETNLAVETRDIDEHLNEMSQEQQKEHKEESEHKPQQNTKETLLHTLNETVQEDSVNDTFQEGEGDLHDDGSSICSEESYTHKKFGQKNLLADPELITISAAERVKFGRKRGQKGDRTSVDTDSSSRCSSPGKDLRKKRDSLTTELDAYKSVQEFSRQPRKKRDSICDMPQDLSNKRKRSLTDEGEPKTTKRSNISHQSEDLEGPQLIIAEDTKPDLEALGTPQNSLFHHDYFGYARNEVPGATESASDSAENADPIKQKNVEKLKNLQKQFAGGTYVQCCQQSCKKWRFLTEYEDPSLVPDYWECSMNQDPKANQCAKGASNQPSEDDPEFVNVKYTCGSLVWARVKGYPWWPGMIDYCPDSEEYYWIEETESKTDPAWYHVVFLDKVVSRSWVRAELVEKMSSPVKPPKNLAVKKNTNSMKARFSKATEMAKDCINLTRKERLEKYSFASLFKGKWADYSDISSDDDTSKPNEEKVSQKSRTSKRSRSNTDSNKRPKKEDVMKNGDGRRGSNDSSFLETFECAKCSEKMVYTKFPVQKHLKKHRLDLKEYCSKFDPDEKNEKFVLIREWIDREEFRKAIAEDPWKPKIAEKNSLTDSDRLKTIEEVVHEQSPKQAEESSVYMNEEESEKFHIKAAITNSENLLYQKPLLAAESLIAVAVRNLDPQNKNGASFCKIVAFISLHFPYFDVNFETCKQLVRKAYGQSPDDDREPTGLFRIKPAVVPRLYAEISPVLKKDKLEIEKSMLHPKFLDIMVERFLEGEKYKHPKQQNMPPYNLRQLALLAYVALKNEANVEQIVVYLLFLFPGFSAHQDIFRKKFLSELCKQKEFETVEYGSDKRFKINQECFEEVVKTLRTFTSVKKNFEDLKASVFDEDFINVLFPGLEIIEEIPEPKKFLEVQPQSHLKPSPSDLLSKIVESTIGTEDLVTSAGEYSDPHQNIPVSVTNSVTNVSSHISLPTQPISAITSRIQGMVATSFVAPIPVNTTSTSDFVRYPVPAVSVVPPSAPLKVAVPPSNHLAMVSPPSTTTSSPRPSSKQPLPNDILVFYIVTLEEKKKKVVTLESIVSELKKLFIYLEKKDFKFVEDVLKGNVFIQAKDGSYQISPHVKPFGTAVLMKYIIDNLDELIKSTSDITSIKTVLPRMEQGSAKLKSDFVSQTLDFSKKKCVTWKPPIPENLILAFAILSTADINDCATHYTIIEFIHENFPWYNLTRQCFGLTMPEKNLDKANPETKYVLSSSETTLVRQQLKTVVVSSINQLKNIMPRPEIFNTILDPQNFFQPETQKYTKPPLPDGVMVAISLLHMADDFGWASALKIQRFVEMNFPFYELDMATRFLANISGWIENKTFDSEFFNVEREQGGMMAKYQIKSDKLLTAFSWIGKYICFDESTELPNKLFMKSPELIKEILSLPPPNWKNYYAPAVLQIRATPLAKILSPTNANQLGNQPGVQHTTRLVTLNRNIFQAQGNPLQIQPNQRQHLQPSGITPLQNNLLPQTFASSAIVPIVSVAPLDHSANSQQCENTLESDEHEWKKPNMETHVRIALALVLNDCKEYHECNDVDMDYAPSNDIQVSQFSLHRKHNLSEIVGFLKEVFPYYESRDHIREFVVNDIQHNKTMVSQYFNLAKNADDKLEYELKLSVLGSIYEEMLNITDWNNTEELKYWIRNPQYAEKIFAERPPLSEATILSLILFLHGEPQDSYSLCIDSVVNVMINEVGIYNVGLSGKQWGETKLRKALKETILKLVAVGDDFNRDLSTGTINISLITEEGKVDELFANLQENIFNITNKTYINDSLQGLLTKFMEMGTPPTASTEPIPPPIPPPVEPPFPRNFLIALALKNLSPIPGSPVLMSKIWNFITTHFPYFELTERWPLSDLRNEVGFSGKSGFVLNEDGDDFTVMLAPDRADELFKEVSEFSKENVASIQSSMRVPETLAVMDSGITL